MVHADAVPAKSRLAQVWVGDIAPILFTVKH